MPPRIITPDRFVTAPWKNGGGITHEIARHAEGGRLVWRLSVAEVESDGPFSRFDGMMRILTVIEGAGLRLATPQGDLAAMPREPVRFAGDLPVDGRRVAGPVRDLNVIFNPARIAASVAHLRAADVCRPRAAEGRSYALLCLGGEIRIAPGAAVGAGSVAIFSEVAEPIRFSPEAEALLVTLDRLVEQREPAGP